MSDIWHLNNQKEVIITIFCHKNHVKGHTHRLEGKSPLLDGRDGDRSVLVLAAVLAPLSVTVLVWGMVHTIVYAEWF